MKILILHTGSSVLGGIETLMFRMTSFLVKNGHEVTVIVGDDTFVDDFADQELRRFVHRLDGYHHDVLITKRLRAVLARHNVTELDGVIALDIFSALSAPLVAQIFSSSNCTAVVSNWMPDYYEFIRENPWHPLAWLMRWNLRTNYCSETILMMTRNYIEDGKSILGQSWAGTVFPIPIRGAQFLKIERNPVPGRIVSVGRLSDMKEYNLHMPGVIKDLRNAGFDVSWDVYGDGPLKASMEAQVRALELDAHVNFMGVVGYADLPTVFRKAKYFVGMGTAALEAALAGVPVAYALPFRDDGASCGPIYDADIGNFEELIEMRSDRTVRGELTRLLEMDAAAYDAEAEKARSCAMKSEESVVMPRLLDAFKSGLVNRRGLQSYRRMLFVYALSKRLLTAFSR